MREKKPGPSSPEVEERAFMEEKKKDVTASPGSGKRRDASFLALS